MLINKRLVTGQFPSQLKLVKPSTWHVLFLALVASYGQAQLSSGTSGGSAPGSGGVPTGGGTGGVMPGGTGTGGPSTGSGGSRPGMPFLPMMPHAPNAIHHVGIGYNLLKGNPDGEYWSTGGEDPGVSLTRKIFTISPGDHPPEAIIEHHDGCQYSHGFSLFYDTKSYQDKLYINVQTSGAADAALKPYGFTLSSAYQAVTQQTSHHHYVFQDATTYCKMGHVRYSMNLAVSDHYPVNREFALDVCNLPTTYNAVAYMKFIEDWGTHVMTEVTIGKLTTMRYLGRLRDLFNFVMYNVTDDIKPGGAMSGYPESYVIDVDSFKYRHEYKYIVGVFEDMLSVGDRYYNDVIGKTLQTIDMALDTKYWHFMSYYVAQNICSSDASSHLSTWQANIVMALKAYPNYKTANAPAVQPLAMPATMPLGSYSLPKPASGCPQGYVEGAVILPQPSHYGGAPTGLNLDGQLSASQYELKFCTREDPSPGTYDILWPKGDYCVLKYDSCPYGFQQSYVQFGGVSNLNFTGILPSVTAGSSSYAYVYFCCRSDAVYSKPIFLPKSKPFYLFRYKHGCQTVSGMKVQDQVLTFYNAIYPQTGYTPYIEATTDQHMHRKYDFHYCYYTALT